MLADNVMKSNVTGLPILQYYEMKTLPSDWFRYAASRCMWYHAAGVRHLRRKGQYHCQTVHSSLRDLLYEAGSRIRAWSSHWSICYCCLDLHHS